MFLCLKSLKMVRIALFMMVCVGSSCFVRCSDSDVGVIVESIDVRGNRKINKQAILSKLPFKIGDSLNSCRTLTSESLRRISNMGYFKDGSIRISVEPGSSQHTVVLVLDVEEKPLLSGYFFEGNSEITAKKLIASLGLDSVLAVDEDDVQRMCKQIERVYRKENFLAAKVSAELEPDGQESVKIKFYIEEGPKTRVLKVNFVGCKSISEQKLRSALFTREDWILAPIDNAGKFDRDMIERDKRVIEQFYKERGYFNASVPEVKVSKADNEKDVEVTFYIEEGGLYRIGKVDVPYDDEFDALLIERSVVVREGDPYSLGALQETVLRLECVFGDHGYIFVRVVPEEFPDHTKKTVDIRFRVDKGEKCYINEIEITGNRVTKDFVIRRELLLEEGQLASRSLMERSRQMVEYLDYFERGSVDWRVHKIDDGKVNLELVVKEKKSGQASLALNYGPGSGGKASSAFVFDIHKRNFMGMGYDVGSAVQMGGDGGIKTAFLDFDNPHLFDRDISFGFRTYLSKVDLEAGPLDPQEETLGGLVNFGFMARPFGYRLLFGGEIGVESVDYKLPNDTFFGGRRFLSDAAAALSDYKKELFEGSDYAWFGGRVSWNRFNYKVNPTRGFGLELRNKTAYSFSKKNSDLSNIEGHSMFKLEMYASFFWPLVEDDKLVFSAKAKLGIVEPLGNPRTMPIINKELFKVGGIHTLRGFKWGEAGPMFRVSKNSSPIPIGAKKMFLSNFELASPIGSGPTAPVGFLFLDVGAGWDAQKLSLTTQQQKDYLVNDRPNIRLAAGFGIKFSVPYPIRIDYGYKLNRQGGEEPSELHISMNVPF